MPVIKKATYPELPEDQPLVCEIVDVDPNARNPFGEEPRVKLVFEVSDGPYQGARIWASVNPVLSDRSTLGQIARAVYDDPNLQAVDTDDLAGRQLVIVGEYPDPDKRDFLRPRKFKPAHRDPREPGPGAAANAMRQDAPPAASRHSAEVSEPPAKREAVATAGGPPDRDEPAIDF